MYDIFRSFEHINDDATCIHDLFKDGHSFDPAASPFPLTPMLSQQQLSDIKSAFQAAYHREMQTVARSMGMQWQDGKLQRDGKPQPASADDVADHRPKFSELRNSTASASVC